MEYLSLYRYITGAGGVLLLALACGLGVFVSHLYYNDPDHPLYDLMSTGVIGMMLGVILIFVLIPTACFIRSTYMCYNLM